MCRSCRYSVRRLAQGTAAHLAQTQRLGDGGDDESQARGGDRGARTRPRPGTASATSAATWMASRVLPTPPGPVRVKQADVGAEQQGGGRGGLALAADEGSERGRQIRSMGRKSGHGCADHVRGQAGAIIVGLRYAVNDGSDCVLRVSPFHPSAVACRP